MKNSITQITEDFIKKIGEIFKESEKLYETEEKIKLQTQNLATSLVELFIEQIDNEILRDKKKRKAEGYSVERRGDRRSILFSYGQVEFEKTYYKKASGGYEYLADTAVGINERDRISEICYAALLQAQRICLIQSKPAYYGRQNKPTDCNELCERK